MKTSELTGPALDLIVAKLIYSDIGNTLPFHPDGTDFSPSRKWAHGGPIIERESMGVWFCDEVIDDDGNIQRKAAWYAEDSSGDNGQIGSTPLIAAMRCFVASKLGDEVDHREGRKALDTFNALFNR